MRASVILFCAVSSVGALFAASYFGALMHEGTDTATGYATIFLYLTLAAEAGSLWSAFKLGSEQRG